MDDKRMSLGRLKGVVNTVRKLQRREISSKRYHGFNNAEECFRNFQLQGEYDTCDPEEVELSLSFQNDRSMITKIFTAGDVIFACTLSGVWVAFSRDNMKKICNLNVIADNVSLDLFYDKRNDSIITVSNYALEDFFICRTTRIEYIKRGETHAGSRIFESELLKCPGSVEFDDGNGKVITYSVEDNIYKVFDLENYKFLYSILDNNIQQIKSSPGVLLLVHKITPLGVPLKIVSVQDGTVLKSFNYLGDSNKYLDFITLFNEKLFVKPHFENLQIMDVRNSEVIAEVDMTEFSTRSIILYEHNLILKFACKTLTLWNFCGELVTSFEDHVSNNIRFTSTHDLVIYVCRPSDGDVGYINISNILSGKCVGKITKSNSRKYVKASWSTVAGALKDITAIFYDKERNEIYSGTRLGLVHVWSN